MSARNFWTNWAAGRATVRNRALRKARILKADLASMPDEYLREKMARVTSIPRYDLSIELARKLACNEIALLVRNARRAHHDWRRYRKHAADEIAFNNHGL